MDFAGSTIVHSTGGWAALAGLLVIGPRLGKFRKNGSVKSTPPSNVLVVTLGVLILWLGWFGFNGGSQPALVGAKFHIQLLGVVSVGAFVFVASLIVWKVMDLVMGLRVSVEVERLGQDTGELGIETYPEFVLMPEEFDE